MPRKLCERCNERAACVLRYDRSILCRECFCRIFEEEVHNTITKYKLFKSGQKVAIGASGGKDSAVLMQVMKILNERYDYGLKLCLLSIDEGISGYRDHSLEEVKFHSNNYGLELKILSYKDLYNWSMDEIVSVAGRKSNCTFCGVFRRQALDRGAWQLGVDIVATGHNGDDVAETVLMNMLRGDVGRLSRCTAISTADDPSGIPRVKPLKYQYEAEIVKYARHSKVRYFSTECTYAPGAHRGQIREYLRAATKIRPHVVLDIIKAGEGFEVKDGIKMPIKTRCTRCDYISSQPVCKACLLLEGLNSGRPLLGIGKTKAGRVKKYKTVKVQSEESCEKKDNCCEKKKSCSEQENKCESITEDDIETCGSTAALTVQTMEKLSIAAEASDLF
ncbi:unnamed protein product [Oikopleura dioica]|uniref:Cytoplasmic tRNA 2-thiolation protein 1 n=1 Tax=Oikopleura dioica TaxID=34765 RepID=E4YKX3_OIKDI|nr:unnamed protein product [Oikopleura dioica]